MQLPTFDKQFVLGLWHVIWMCFVWCLPYRIRMHFTFLLAQFAVLALRPLFYTVILVAILLYLIPLKNTQDRTYHRTHWAHALRSTSRREPQLFWWIFEIFAEIES